MDESIATVTLTLPADAALVLDALLADIDAPSQLAISGTAELQAVRTLSAALERELVEILKPDYEKLLHEARERLARQSG